MKINVLSIFSPYNFLCFCCCVSLVTKCVYIDVKQHNTTSPTQTSCLNMEIWRYIRLIVALLNAPQQHDGSFFLSYVYAAAILGEKPKASYFYMEITTSLSCCINLLLQQRNAQESFSLSFSSAVATYSREDRAISKKNCREEHVIDLTIKPLNITITTNVEWRCTEWKLLKHKIYHRKEAAKRKREGFTSAQVETWK